MLLKEALAGRDIDVTSGPLGRSVLLLAIPMMLEMIMESVFALCDVFYVSRLGVEAVATVGLTEAMLTILYAVAIGLAMGTTAMVARRIGERRTDAAVETTVQAIALAVIAAALIGVPGAIFAEDLLRLMGGSPEVVEAGKSYTAIVLGASATVTLLFLINAAFRGAGDASLAMRSLWLANGVNLILDPCLIFGLGPFPELGLTGAAIATAIGRGSGVLYQLAVLTGRRGRIQVRARHIRLRLEVLLRLARVSVGGILQLLIATTSWVALVRVVGTFGSAAVAGYTIAIRLILFALLPSWGLANSAATMVGQNLGAGQPDRAGRSVWAAGRYNVGFLVAVAVVFIVAADRLIGLFSADAEVLAAGADCLRIISYGYGFYALGMVLIQAFNGAGDTMTPTYVNLGCYWLLQLPLAYGLAVGAGLGPRGVFIAVLVAESVMTVAAAILFLRGSWRHRVV
jgi:putative MATE family efflux protein